VSRTRNELPWRGLALLVAGAFFMENLDGTIVATAAPRMAESFGVHSVDLNVVMTAYLLALAMFIPVSGWIADRIGARTVFASAIVVFTVASGLCAISSSLGELTAMRVLQGIGGAMMVPVGRLVVLRSTSKAELISAIAYLTWPALVAPVIAPALGGLFATYSSWRWIFAINLPLGLLAFLLALRMVPNTRPDEHIPLDWRGFALSGLGLATLAFGLELMNGRQVRWHLVGATVAAGTALIAIAVLHLRRERHPLINLEILRIPTFRIANLGGSSFRMAISAVPFLLPLLFQDGFGWTPFKSGLMVIAVFAGNIAIKPATTPILRRFGFRRVLLAAGIAAGVTLALCAFLEAGTPLPVVALALFLSGVFRSIGFTAYNTIAFADVEPHQTSDASTLFATTQQLSAGMGVAVGALALRLGNPICDFFGMPLTAVRPFGVALVLVALFAFLAAVESALMTPHAGVTISSVPANARQTGRRRSRV
jgi:EmrB/QacA subfamily drug resistance transporter